MKFNKKVFTNGLTLVTVPMVDNPTATVMVMTATGSQYEIKSNNGISHFLEHLVFKGTTKRPSSKIITEELEGLGAQYNAFTSQSCTGYYAKGKVADWVRLLDVISDIYLNPSIPADELERERGVILEEINMYQDNPQYVAHEAFQALALGDQSAGWPVLGVKTNIKNLSRSTIKTYHKKHYVANKTIIVIAGGVKHSEVVKIVDKIFQEIPVTFGPGIKPALDKQIKPQRRIINRPTDQAHLLIGYRSYPINHVDHLVVKVLAMILGGGMSSRLFRRVREELGAAYYISATQWAEPNWGLFVVRAGLDTKRSKMVLGIIREELQRLCVEFVSIEELTRVKSMIEASFVLNLESSDDFANYYATKYAMGLDMTEPEVTLKNLKKVTPEDLIRVAVDIISKEKENLVVVGPKGIMI